MTAATILPKLLQSQIHRRPVAPNYHLFLPCQLLGDLILRLRWMEEALPGVPNSDKLLDTGWSGESSNSAQLTEELPALGGKLPNIWPIIDCCVHRCLLGVAGMAVLSDLAKLILGETRLLLFKYSIQKPTAGSGIILAHIYIGPHTNL